MTREEWLLAAVRAIKADILPECPDVAVSVGWPSTKALARKSRRIGECWGKDSCQDGRPAIFVSPIIADKGQVLHVLAHELCHAVAGHKAAHKAGFQRVAKGIGLEPDPKWSGTKAGEVLAARLHALPLPDYPHSPITANGKEKKQGTRMLKATCPADGYTVRLTRKWIEDMGYPVCPCGEELQGE